MRTIDEVKNKTGFYLVLEGVDFCGKTTLATKLVEKLIEKYGSINVVHKTSYKKGLIVLLVNITLSQFMM